MPGAGQGTLTGIIDRTPQLLPLLCRLAAGTDHRRSGRTPRPEPPPMPTRYDAAWKLLFAFPVMLHDLLAEFVPREWVEHLDLSQSQDRSANLVSNGLHQRHQDVVWEVSFRGGTGSVLVALEFQSTVDPTMAVRMLVYTTLHYQGRLRKRQSPDKQDPSSEQEPPEDREVPPDQDPPSSRESADGEASAGHPPEPLPSVLPIVLYHGKAQWTAEEDMAGLCVPPAENLALYQPAQRYFLLDLDRYSAPLPEGRNLFAILVRLVQSRHLEEEATVVDALIEWLHEETAPEALARAFWAWMGYAHVPKWRQKMTWPVLRDWREAGTMLRESVNEWTTMWMAQGRVEGRTEGQIAVMRRLTARKFGRETADRLAERLAEIPDPERLGEVGEWILECGKGEALLARVARLCETAAAEDCASQG